VILCGNPFGHLYDNASNQELICEYKQIDRKGSVLLAKPLY